ncbi:hypothetical protein [Rhodococcus sp. (in: high G+C Gram-positive bacteria)]|uniref:hypothetical protein n=1 Tax=Rhodococcus sp. TaxID=1831 RepID=UPI00388E34CC
MDTENPALHLRRERRLLRLPQAARPGLHWDRELDRTPVGLAAARTITEGIFDQLDRRHGDFVAELELNGTSVLSDRWSCPAWPKWATKIRDVRSMMERAAQREQPAAGLRPIPQPLAIIRSGLSIADVIVKLEQLQQMYPDAEVRRGRAGRIELQPREQNSLLAQGIALDETWRLLPNIAAAGLVLLLGVVAVALRDRGRR